MNLRSALPIPRVCVNPSASWLTKTDAVLCAGCPTIKAQFYILDNMSFSYAVVSEDIATRTSSYSMHYHRAHLSPSHRIVSWMPPSHRIRLSKPWYIVPAIFPSVSIAHCDFRAAIVAYCDLASWKCDCILLHIFLCYIHLAGFSMSSKRVVQKRHSKNDAHMLRCDLVYPATWVLRFTPSLLRLGV